MSWQRLCDEAPEIARLSRERIDATRVLLLGTLRPDGSPRISPVEPYLSGPHLVIGAMAWSRKVADLDRDARCVLHGTVSGPESGEPELKLYGRALAAADEVRAACTDGWWHEAPAGAARVYSVDLREAVFVEWDYEAGELTVRRWVAGEIPTSARRAYP